VYNSCVIVMSAWRTLVSQNLRELRFHFCQHSKGSEGLRDFVRLHYKDLKSKNNGFPFLVRECQGAEAKVWARFGAGKETAVSVEGMNAKSVEDSLKELVGGK